MTTPVDFLRGRTIGPLIALALAAGTGAAGAAPAAATAAPTAAPATAARNPALATPAASTENPSPIRETAEQARAEALLERAAEHLKQRGEAGVADFNRQAAFVDRELYVYALRTDGIFLASGGGSAALIGTNVLDEIDNQGRKFFREMLDEAQSSGSGRIEYQWFNPASFSGEPKQTLFRKIGDVIVAVGFYAPRATQTDAKALLRRAVAALRSDETSALASFQRFPGPYIRDDLYVFVVDLDSGRILADGANPSLMGTDARTVQDVNGRPIVTESIEMAAREGKGVGELVYSWHNPTSGRIENKHTFFRSVDGKLVGVGYFTR